MGFQMVHLGVGRDCFGVYKVLKDFEVESFDSRLWKCVPEKHVRGFDDKTPENYFLLHFY